MVEMSGGAPPPKSWLLLLALPLPVVFFGIYLLTAGTQLSYRVEPDAVVIEAKVGAWDQSRTIPKARITSAALLDARSARRTAGTGLPGYCSGSFEIDGTPAWAATDCGHALVRLETLDGAVVISPIDRDGFVAAAIAPGKTGTFSPEKSERPWWPVLLVVPLLLPLFGVALLIRRIWRPLVYRIERGELVVPAHFGEVRTKLAGARYRRGDPGRLFRVAGTGFPGFHLGKYRAFGSSVHMAATRRTDLVLIESDRRVVVSPVDTARFIEAIGAQGARPV